MPIIDPPELDFDMTDGSPPAFSAPEIFGEAPPKEPLRHEPDPGDWDEPEDSS